MIFIKFVKFFLKSIHDRKKKLLLIKKYAKKYYKIINLFRFI